MLTFTLVHGAWHDGSCWDATGAHLQKLGHKVFTPTLAGHGPGADKSVSHADCCASLVSFLEERDIVDTILVGHSFGGSVISKVAEAVPHRIRRLVYHNAFVLRDGDCVADENPPHYRTMIEEAQAAAPGDGFMLPANVWREAFCNDTTDSVSTEAYAKLSAQPLQPFFDKLDLKRFYELAIPRTYLNATEDTALPPGTEWGWHPRMSSRLGLFRLVQMSGGHEVMYTSPVLLAEKLVEAGRP